MCGIAGAYFADRQPADAAWRVVQAMTDALSHRGPDGGGVRACGPLNNEAGPTVVLGHRRLAILDLSDRAAQPMATSDGSIVLSFNGEIYNFRDVRDALRGKGRVFQSESDVEVLLQGYQEWGEAVLDRLRGMFAFAIWDGPSQRLVLARDRMGIKPLYLFAASDRLLFASEIRALLASGLVPRRLDRRALERYLAYQTVPSPATLVEGVRAMGPGEIVHVNAAGIHSRTYWDLLTCGAGSQNDHDGARARTASLLEEAAALHMISDVPVGLFLSGGIDSSAIAALLRRGGFQPRTFVVTCPGTPFDEAPYARAVARSVGAEHTEITLTERDVLEQVQHGVRSVDHPSGDGLNTYIVARAVRRAGLKVALSGLGGDEFFGGYRSFDRLPWLSRYAKAWRWSPVPVRQAASAAVRSVGAGSVAALKTAALVATDGSLPQTFPILRQVFSPEQRRELLRDAPSRTEPDPYVALLHDAVSRQTHQDLMALVSYAEARTYMHDVLLRDADQMSMAHGLEVRVPLLDHHLVEHLMGLPESAKRGGGGPKPLLVDSVGPGLPVECVDRPKKGFVLPFDLWMRDALRPFCELHLGPRGLLGWDLFRPAAVRSLWSAFLSDDGRTTWSRPWTLVALDAWMRANEIEP